MPIAFLIVTAGHMSVRVLSRAAVVGLRHRGPALHLPRKAVLSGRVLLAQYSTSKASVGNQTAQTLSAMAGPASPTFSMGPGTLAIDRQAFHQPLRAGVVQRMQAKLPESQRGIAVLQVRGVAAGIWLSRRLITFGWISCALHKQAVLSVVRALW